MKRLWLIVGVVLAWLWSVGVWAVPPTVTIGDELVIMTPDTNWHGSATFEAIVSDAPLSRVEYILSGPIWGWNLSPCNKTAYVFPTNEMSTTVTLEGEDNWGKFYTLEVNVAWKETSVDPAVHYQGGCSATNSVTIAALKMKLSGANYLGIDATGPIGPPGHTNAIGFATSIEPLGFELPDYLLTYYRFTLKSPAGCLFSNDEALVELSVSEGESRVAVYEHDTASTALDAESLDTSGLWSFSTNFTVVALDAQMQGLTEAQEEDPGAIIGAGTNRAEELFVDVTPDSLTPEDQISLSFESPIEVFYDAAMTQPVTTNLLPWADTMLYVRSTNGTERLPFTLAHNQSGAKDMVKMSVLKVNLDVDSDNSGAIDAADDNAEDSKEFLFWLNNNNDYGYVWGHDCDDDVIGGSMDLQDLAPFKITLFKDAFPSGSKVFLEMEGGPAVVRVFKHRGTGTQHLSDSAIANSMASDSGYQTGVVGGGDRIELNLSDFANAVPIWFVLEGKTAGAGRLCVVVRQTDGTELCRDVTLLNLHDIDDLWSEINLRNCTGAAPAAAGPIYSSWASGIDNDDVTWNISDGKWGRTNNSVVISIHGYNNTAEEGRDYNRTVFKRLYWRGYRSELAAVLWTGDEGSAPHFNANVFNSFQAGSALGFILPSVKAFAGSRHLVMMTHSLGNNVASEAVRDNSAGVVKDYVMCEAATGQGAYLSGTVTSGSENQKLLSQARTFGYRQAAGGLDFDELWMNRWSANPELHPGNANDWWLPPPTTAVGQPSFVDYQVRWGDCYVNPDPQRGYFASVPGKLNGMLYCGYSAADDVVGDTTAFNAWMDNQIGFLLVGPFRPDSGADDVDWDFDDMFDEDLPEQIDTTVTPAVITSKMRRWAEMSYYFCDLTMAAGSVGIGNGAKYQSDDSEPRGIDGHSAMRFNPLHSVWDFWGWVEGILGP